MAPQVPRETVHRARLRDRLDASDATTIVVSAPAGYGKSTLLAEWAAADTRPAAWCSLDAGDNDPFVFVSYLALCIRDLGVLDDRMLVELTAADLFWENEILPRLAETIASSRVRFVLVLDDVHALDGPSRDVVLPKLAACIPAGSVLLLATREASPLPAGRLRVIGQLDV